MADKIFFDTNPIIYLLDGTAPFSQKVQNFILDAKKNNSELYTSTITDAEFIVKPLEEKQFNKIALYYGFLNTLGFLKCFINEQIAERSAQIRVKYKSIKLADSLQIASAIESDCNIFLTNDKQLKQISEINIQLIDDL